MPFDVVAVYKEHGFYGHYYLSSVKFRDFQILAYILLVEKASSCSSDHLVS